LLRKTSADGKAAVQKNSSFLKLFLEYGLFQSDGFAVMEIMGGE
jgi:hypothetical protein